MIRFDTVKLLVLDFDGVFTDNTVIVNENGKESVICNRGDGLGIGMIKDWGVEVIVLSTETNKVVEARCKKLDIECVHGLKIKEIQLQKEIDRRNLSSQDVCFVGNDINDLECLKMAGIAVVPSDSHESVKSIAHVTTESKGGKGVVRELADLFQQSLESR